MLFKQLKYFLMTIAKIEFNFLQMVTFRLTDRKKTERLSINHAS